MGRSYAPEFRHRVVQRVRSGRSVKSVAAEVGTSEASVFRWMAQDRVDRGESPGQPSRERSELASARRRIRELETELAIVKRASEFYGSLDKIRTKRKYPVIAHLTGQGYSTRNCCRILDVSRAGYLLWKRRGPTQRDLRRVWLTGLIREIHTASRGTYGRRRVLAELVIGRRQVVNKKLVARIMTECGIFGLPSQEGSPGTIGRGLLHRSGSPQVSE